MLIIQHKIPDLAQDRNLCTANIGHMEKSAHSTVNPCNQVYSYPTVFFTFNCCSKCSGKTVNLKYSDLLYYLHFGIVLCMVNNCAWYSKPLYFRFTVFTCVFTVISLYIFAVCYTYLLHGLDGVH